MSPLTTAMVIRSIVSRVVMCLEPRVSHGILVVEDPPRPGELSPFLHQETSLSLSQMLEWLFVGTAEDHAANLVDKEDIRVAGDLDGFAEPAVRRRQAYGSSPLVKSLHP
jgi:hypothetical protein